MVYSASGRVIIEPELDFKAQDLQVNGPQPEIELALILEDKSNGETLELQGSPGP